MGKKVYRSLFDSEDVFEVEELTDDPEVSTEGIATVKKDASGEPVQHTVEDCWDAIQKIADAVGCKLGKGVTDANEPGESTKVTKQNPTIDTKKDSEEGEEDDETKNKKVGDAEEGEEGEEDDKGAAKDVKDAYKPFTSVGEKKKVDTAVATQVAFQHRYDAVANK